MNFTEIEFKYNASGVVTLQEFRDFCQSKKPKFVRTVFAKDTFFSSVKRPSSFYRYRADPERPELTYKRKLFIDDNSIRSEHNIRITKDFSLEQAQAFVGEFGYEKTGQVHKYNEIFILDYLTLSYSVCYDNNMKELGRFIEVEINEDSGIESEQGISELKLFQKMMKPLGLTNETRVKESLFELYGRDNEETKV